MPAYNFKPQFVEPIQSGQKSTTIRPPRRRPTRAGDILYLYTGMRTKKCRHIGIHRCVKVEPVVIHPDKMDMRIGGLACTNRAIADIAQADGFASAKAFFQFFEKTYGTGQLDMELIEWDPEPLEG
jgi:hypothetical protein